MVLTADVVFINQLAFVVTLSGKLCFGTIQYVRSRKASSLVKALNKVITLYTTRGLNLASLLMDREFECLKGKIQTLVNTTAADEHVPEIERRNRVIKERFRAARNRAPHFKKFPNIVIIELARQNVLWLNAFPVKASVLKEISPPVMLTGIPIDYKKHCRCPLLAFVHTHELIDSIDKVQTIGAICLGPTGNEQGTYTFLNLATGRRI